MLRGNVSFCFYFSLLSISGKQSRCARALQLRHFSIIDPRPRTQRTHPAATLPSPYFPPRVRTRYRRVGVGRDLRKGDAGRSDKLARDHTRDSADSADPMRLGSAIRRSVDQVYPRSLAIPVVRSPETLKIQAGMRLRGDRALGNLYRGADRYCGMPLTGRYYCKSLDNRA